jgi:hypothetical protein
MLLRVGSDAGAYVSEYQISVLEDGKGCRPRPHASTAIVFKDRRAAHVALNTLSTRGCKASKKKCKSNH